MQKLLPEIPSRMDPKQQLYISVLVLLIIMYIAVIIGLGLEDSRPYFMPYISLLFLLTGLSLLYFHKGWNNAFLIYMLITLLGTFCLQYFATKTSLVYGQTDKYGDSFGPKILGVPIAFTFNRFIMLYCVGILALKLRLPSDFLAALTGAAVLLFISVVSDPVATNLKLRTWTSSLSPFHNYSVKFLTSFIFLYLFYRMKFTKRNKLYLPVFLMEAGFFLLFNLIWIS